MALYCKINWQTFILNWLEIVSLLFTLGDIKSLKYKILKVYNIRYKKSTIYIEEGNKSIKHQVDIK